MEAATWLDQLHILAEIAMAMVLGGLIGLERELADKPAGLRTHMLVAATSALLVGLGVILMEMQTPPGEQPSQYLESDPIRIIQAIIIGIGFLGAGTIIRQRKPDNVEGLTTGASLLFSAALGICVASGAYALAVCATILALAVLRSLGLLEARMARRRKAESSPPHEKQYEGKRS